MSLKFDELKKIYGDNIYRNEILSKYSWFNLGGPSEIFFRPNSVAQLSSTTFPVPIEMVGVNDSFGESGKPHELLIKYGLDAKNIVSSVERVISRK